MSEFNYIDVVKLGLNAANARTPRMQKSAIAEFGRILSQEVTAGEWSADGDRMLNSAGQTVEEYLDFLISTRPHWLIPATIVSSQDTTWLDGSLAAQGKRWKELRAFLGNDAATNAAMNAEAALYGAKVGSTVPGRKPGTKATADEKPVAANNPYSDAYAKKHGIEAARAEIGRIMKSPLGIKGATALAAAVGCFVTGAKKPS
jgi:hypothetical protein